jgi:hypothetical protein
MIKYRRRISGFKRWLYRDHYREVEPWPLWLRVSIIMGVVLLALAK